MSEQTPEPIYKGELDAIDSIDGEAPIASARARVCEYYNTLYGEAAKEADEQGQQDAGHVYRFLGVLSSFSVDFGDGSQKFKPMWVMNGRRSLIPDDFQGTDFKAVRHIADKLSDPALRARAYDVLWLEERNHLDCEQAANAYIQAGQELDTEENWTYAITHYRRGLVLAAKLGRKQEAFEAGEEKVLQAIERDRSSEVGFRTCQLLELAKESGIGDSSVLSGIAKEATSMKMSICGP